ncbi:MAG: AEC family transporter [bacterium]|nr:AEC family transporter [bacterium]
MQVVYDSVRAVVTLLLAAGCGVYLVRRKILHEQARRDLSLVVFHLTLPCLLFSSIVRAVSVDALRQWWLLPVAAVVHCGIGFLVGLLVVWMSRPPSEFRRDVVVTTAFGNGAYLPFAIVGIIALDQRELLGAQAAADGVTYVSLYLVAYTAMQWLVGYPFLTHRPWRELSATHVISPPIIAASLAMVLGLIPWTKGLFCGPGAMLEIIPRAAEIIGQATVPCALLITGANLAHSRSLQAVGLRALVGAAAGRFVIVPGVSVGLTWVLWGHGWIGSPMMFIVLVLQSFMPPAMNLMIMCEILGRNKQGMSALVFWLYVVAIPALASWLALTLWLLQ